MQRIVDQDITLAGIDQLTLNQAISNLPQIKDLLIAMIKAKLFSDDTHANVKLFETLLASTEHLAVFGKTQIITNGVLQANDPNETKYSFCHGNNIDNLVFVYQLLVGDEKKPCLLSPITHAGIMEILSDGYWLFLENFKTMLQEMQTSPSLTATSLEKLFSAPSMCDELMRALRYIDTESKLYLLNKITNPDQIVRFTKLFRGPSGRGETVHPTDSFLYGERPWITNETFKMMVDHIDLCHDVLPRFLAKSVETDFYKDLASHIKIPVILHSLFTLKLNGVPINDLNVSLVFAVPSLGNALSFCRDSGFIQQPMNDDNHDEYVPLLVHVPLIKAVNTLATLHQALAAEGKAASKAAIQQDLHDVYDCVSHEPGRLKKGAMKMFHIKPKTATLEATLLRIQHHYKGQSPSLTQ